MPRDNRRPAATAPITLLSLPTRSAIMSWDLPIERGKPTSVEVLSEKLSTNAAEDAIGFASYGVGLGGQVLPAIWRKAGKRALGLLHPSVWQQPTVDDLPQDDGRRRCWSRAPTAGFVGLGLGEDES